MSRADRYIDTEFQPATDSHYAAPAECAECGEERDADGECACPDADSGCEPGDDDEADFGRGEWWGRE